MRRLWNRVPSTSENREKFWSERVDHYTIPVFQCLFFTSDQVSAFRRRHPDTIITNDIMEICVWIVWKYFLKVFKFLDKFLSLQVTLTLSLCFYFFLFFCAAAMESRAVDVRKPGKVLERTPRPIYRSSNGYFLRPIERCCSDGGTRYHIYQRHHGN